MLQLLLRAEALRHCLTSSHQPRFRLSLQAACTAQEIILGFVCPASEQRPQLASLAIHPTHQLRDHCLRVQRSSRCNNPCLLTAAASTARTEASKDLQPMVATTHVSNRQSRFAGASLDTQRKIQAVPPFVYSVAGGGLHTLLLSNAAPIHQDTQRLHPYITTHRGCTQACAAKLVQLDSTC